MISLDACDLAGWVAELGADAAQLAPWALPPQLAERVLLAGDARLRADPTQWRRVGEGVWHASATVEAGAVIKGPVLIGPGCFIAAGVTLRGGVWLAERVTLGPGCELKATLVLAGSALAHFNYVGDSLIGSGVNFEAGAVVANHHNERVDKRIWVRWADGALHDTGVTKFGALVGDGCKIGANAVLSPGTVLAAGAVVPRLGLVAQDG
jgi:NDP-sugar pyrophosphorylase family protein